MISSINKLFRRHSRILFGLFTIVIIISFIGFMVPGRFGMGGCSHARDARVGTAFGEVITYDDLHNEVKSISILSFLYSGNFNEIKKPEAFYSICLNKVAKQRGIFATDAEVADLVKVLPIFQVDNKFNYTQYEKALERLKTMGFDDEMVAIAMRKAIVSQKLQENILGSVVITSGEAEEFYQLQNETTTIKIAEFIRGNYVNDVKYQPQEIKDFFDARQSEYTVPAHMKAKIVKFPYNTPEVLKEASKVSDSEIKNYFDQNAYSFITKEGKLPEFDTVKDQVKIQLITDKVREIVTAKAQDFAHSVYNYAGESPDKEKAFIDYAKKQKLAFLDAEEFRADATEIGAIKEPALVKDISNVIHSVPITNAVTGRTAAYVAIRTDYKPERNATFNDVSSKVQEDFIKSASMNLAQDAAREALDKLTNLDAKEVLKSDLWTRTLNFNLMTMPMEPTDRMAAMRAMSQNIGELSEVIPTAEGAIISTVVSIEAAPGNFEEVKEIWEERWKRMKTEIVFGNFQKYLETNCKFELDLSI